MEMVQTAEPVDNYESITPTKNALHDDATKKSRNVFNIPVNRMLQPFLNIS